MTLQGQCRTMSQRCFFHCSKYGLTNCATIFGSFSNAGLACSVWTSNDRSVKCTWFLMLFMLMVTAGCKKIQQNVLGQDLIENGDFELNANAANWQRVPNNITNTNNYVELSSVNPYSGSRSMELHHADMNGCWEQWISQNIEHNLIQKRQTYRVTFWYRADFDISAFNIIFRNGSMDFFQRESVSYSASSGWQSFESELTMPSDIGESDPTFSIHVCEEGVHSVWIDKVSLRAKRRF